MAAAVLSRVCAPAPRVHPAPLDCVFAVMPKKGLDDELEAQVVELDAARQRPYVKYVVQYCISVLQIHPRTVFASRRDFVRLLDMDISIASSSQSLATRACMGVSNKCPTVGKATVVANYIPRAIMLLFVL